MMLKFTIKKTQFKSLSCYRYRQSFASTTHDNSSNYKILLLQPPGSCKTFTRSNSVYPPLGLCQLAATVSDSECIVLDAEGLDMTQEETVSTVVEKRPACIGFTVTTMTMPLVNEYAKLIKKKLTEVVVIVGCCSRYCA